LGKEVVLFGRKEPKDFYDYACGMVEAMANTTGIESGAKVFWFFSSEKNLLPYAFAFADSCACGELRAMAKKPGIALKIKGRGARSRSRC
jgi:hypothetical protein